MVEVNDDTRNYNMPIKDNYDDEYAQTISINKRLRLGFIRKVYSILAFQLIITASFVATTMIYDVRLFLARNFELFYLSLFVSLVTIILLVCFHNLSRKVPVNYALLTIFTVAESYMVGTISAFNPPEIVLTAACLTALVVISLTIYAFTTKTDFTFLGGFLFSFTMIMLFWGIFMLIFGFFWYTLYCVLGVLLFSIYLIFDTQLVLGRFGYKYSIDDYIVAALNIYIDIIQLFLYILDLLRNQN